MALKRRIERGQHTAPRRQRRENGEILIRHHDGPRCAHPADQIHGILTALNDVQTDIPMVARLVGTNEEEGRKILAEANFPSASSLGEAAQIAVKLAKGA